MDNHLKPPITADPADDRGVIELRIVQWGERTVKVDPGEFEKAVTDGALDNYLDVDVSNMDHHTGVITPAGVMLPLYSINETPRRTVLVNGVAAALEDIIRTAGTSFECVDCAHASRRPCPVHLAEHLLEALRLEQLTLVHIEPGSNPWRYDGDG